MDKQPLVSVIMPCYNHEKYVAQAIESVLNQTYKNIEFIVVDNGSTDGSFHVIQQYRDRIDKIYQLKENDLVRAGEILNNSCSGDYIAFMTSDDWWDAEKLEKQMNVFQSMPTVKCCFTLANEADEHLDNIKSKSIFNQENRNRFKWLRKLLEEGNCLAYPSAVVERNVYFESRRELKVFYQLSDWYLWLLILKKHDIYIVQEPLVCFRWHQSGTDHNMSAAGAEASVRLCNESADAVDNMIETMDADTFKSTFEDLLIHKDCSDEEELQCEKLFVMMKLAESDVCGEPGIIHYFYEQSRDLKFFYTLKEKYGYSYLDFQNYSGAHGIGKLITQVRALCAYEQKLIAHMKIAEEVLCSNGNIDERKRLLRKKNFETASPNFEMIQPMITMLADIERKCQDRTITLYMLQKLHECLSSVWDNVLIWDVDFESNEWNEYCEALFNPNIEDDVNYKKMIGFIEKVKLALQDCVEINDDLK